MDEVLRGKASCIAAIILSLDAGPNSLRVFIRILSISLSGRITAQYARVREPISTQSRTTGTLDSLQSNRCFLDTGAGKLSPGKSELKVLVFIWILNCREV